MLARGRLELGKPAQLRDGAALFVAGGARLGLVPVHWRSVRDGLGERLEQRVWLGHNGSLDHYRVDIRRAT